MADIQVPRPTRRKKKRSTLPSGFECIDEALSLIRTDAAGLLPLYLIGTLPLAGYGLLFIFDMCNRSVTQVAVSRGALIMVMLFAWKNLWQALFCRKALAVLSEEEFSWPGVREFVRIGVMQNIVQCWALPFYLISLLTPVVTWVVTWVNTYYVVGGRESDLWSEIKLTSALTSRGVVQQFTLFGVLYVLFPFIAALNIIVLIFAAPFFLNSVLGIDNSLSHISFPILLVGMLRNTTFWSVVMVTTYLLVDPVVRLAYAVRTFYCISGSEGYDLLAGVRRYRLWQRGRTILVAALAAVAVFLSTNVSAQEEGTKAPVAKKSVSSDELEESIRNVLQERDYSWRSPFERELEENEDSLLASLAKGIGEILDNIGTWLKDSWKSLEDFLDSLTPKPKNTPKSSNSSWDWGSFGDINWRTVMLITFAIVVALAITMILIMIRKRRKFTAEADEEQAKVKPDLTKEDIVADELEESEWIKLARELIAKGEFKLALRALFLASIVSLAEGQLLTIARYKTNYEYLQELSRRGHSYQEVISDFEQNMGVFERVWYGERPVDESLLNEFQTRLDAMNSQLQNIHGGAH